MMKRLATALLALLLVMFWAPAVRAAGQVTYSGSAGEFIFAPGSEYSLTDLFPGFKDVMPGDRLEQKILLKNEADRNVKVKIYMRALGAHEDSAEFLSQLWLRVEKAGSEIMFDAAADRPAQLGGWVELGTLYSGGELELNVVLEVPVALDNRYQDQIGSLDWEFMVEELPVEETDPVPDTGDDTGILMYGILFLLSAGVLVILLLPRRKGEAETAER